MPRASPPRAQDLVRRNLSLKVTDYYGEVVGPCRCATKDTMTLTLACRELEEFLLEHPEVHFVTYDHEEVEELEDEGEVGELGEELLQLLGAPALAAPPAGESGVAEEEELEELRVLQL